MKRSPSPKEPDKDSRGPGQRDHRVTGEKLKIFGFDDLMGPGLPFWRTNGHRLKEIIKSYINFLQEKHGIGMVSTPCLGKKRLYELSGHWDHYRENMFPELKLDEKEDYILRPMTCPHHILLYKETVRHEKHLPLAFGENALLYRYEYSGGLMGLERSRCMELIDTHIFCTEETLMDSLNRALDLIEEVKEAFNIQYDHLVLSVRDEAKEKFFQDDGLWRKTEGILEEFMVSRKLEFRLGKGDAAFYGPKIDFQIVTAMNKTITISTIQLDFLLPSRFNLQYMKGESGERGVPIMIHLGIIGTLERFIAYLLERNDGWLPFWISPIQISIIPVNPPKHLALAQTLDSCLRRLKIRTRIEDEATSLSKRISQTIHQRCYGHIVVGDKEGAAIEELSRSMDSLGQSREALLSRVMELVKSNGGATEDKYPEGFGEY